MLDATNWIDQTRSNLEQWRAELDDLEGQAAYIASQIVLLREMIESTEKSVATAEKMMRLRSGEQIDLPVSSSTSEEPAPLSEEPAVAAPPYDAPQDTDQQRMPMTITALRHTQVPDTPLFNGALREPPPDLSIFRNLDEIGVMRELARMGGGVLWVPVARHVIEVLGISRASRKNLRTRIHNLLSASDEFEWAYRGLYRLVPSQAAARLFNGGGTVGP